MRIFVCFFDILGVLWWSGPGENASRDQVQQHLRSFDRNQENVHKRLKAFVKLLKTTSRSIINRRNYKYCYNFDL